MHLSRSDIREVSMRSQETRLRCKRSHMPCNLVKFIFGEPGIRGLAGMAAGGSGEKTTQEKKRVKSEKPQRARKRSAGGRRRSVTTTTDSTMSSDVRSAQSLCRCGGPGKGGAQQRRSEEESKRAARSMCCSFIGAFAHAQSMSAYLQFLPCVLPT